MSLPSLASLVVLGAALAMVAVGCKATRASVSGSHGTAPQTVAATAGRAPDPSDPGDGPTGEGYGAISERDIFRPLVKAPKTSGPGANAPTPGGPAAGKAGEKAGGRPPRPIPPDPTLDLALTGVIQTTDGLCALLERLSTRQGEFVAIGERAFGFTIKAIGADSVTLLQGAKTYVLRLGQKAMPEAGPRGPAAGAQPSPPTSAGPPGRGGPPAGMPDFRNMTPEQRREGFRRWWESLPEDQKARMRQGRGSRGGGGGPAG